MDSLRSMRLRIWRALLSASDQEVADGLSFYPGAHGLCRLFSLLHPPLTPQHVAGIYAALSPMNTWDTNVANILDVLRDWSSAPVNTTDSNLHKALRIRCGEDPEGVLSGRKVRAFYHAVAYPDNSSPVAVDRHLINLALGIVPDKPTQAAMANDSTLYSRVESVYLDLGKREGLGNRLASIAWFVQRRVERTGQIPLLHPGSPVCCGRPMWSHGSARFYCPSCRSTSRPEHCLRLRRTPSCSWSLEYGTEGLRVWRDSKGRACVTLPKQHPYSNSAGYQRLARFLIAEEIGRLPHTAEHTHHKNRKLWDDRIENLSLLSVEYHGQIHASAICVGRGEDGRFCELEEPESSPFAWPRYGAVLGNQAATA